jgi:hypothetical protein
VSDRHRKTHHTREVVDPYAEGWDARTISVKSGAPISNPYSPRSRDAELWTQGWKDFEDNEANPED